MWPQHVMIEDEERDAEAARAAMEPMAKKAAVMAVLYLVVAGLVSAALAALGVSDRLHRGWLVMGILWAGHLDAASWRASEAFRASSAFGRGALAVLDIARRRPALLSLLAFAPLASGLLGLGFGKAGLGAYLARVGVGALLWLDAMMVVCCWASMIGPTELARLEDSAPAKRGRMLAAARRSAWRLGCAAASWGMFCVLAGWR